MKCLGGMARCVAVVVILLLCHGGATEVKDCEALDGVVVVVDHESQKTICSKEMQTSGVETTVYMQTGGDLKGVSLHLTQESDDSKISPVWFDLSSCNSVDNKWIKLKVTLKVSTFGTPNFYIGNEKTSEGCEKSLKPDSITSLSIVAHGSSNWTGTSKPTGGGCEFISRQRLPECTDPPVNTNTAITPAPSTISTASNITNPAHQTASTTTITGIILGTFIYNPYYNPFMQITKACVSTHAFVDTKVTLFSLLQG